jgi:hypothetical protein
LQQHKGGSSVFGVSEQLKQLGEEAESTEVEGISLDEYFADKGVKVDLIKVDAEGSEPYVFEGASNLLRENSNVTVICEFYPSMIAQGGKDPRSFLVHVESLGFRLRTINESSRIVSISKDDLLKANLSELYLRR